jgi:hypothetical protein
MRLLTVATALALLAASGLQNAQKSESKQLPPGVLKALAPQAKAYCDQFRGSFKQSCHQTFQTNLRSRQLVITPSGDSATLVEDDNMGDCGSAGCGLFLFLSYKKSHFVQILGAQGDVGTLGEVTILKTATRGHYDIQKAWKSTPGVTVYRWNGLRYAAN